MVLRGAARRASPRDRRHAGLARTAGDGEPKLGGATRRILLAFLPALAVIAGAMTPQEAHNIAALAEAGDSGAQLTMALLYLKGNGGLAQDIDRALRWLRRAAAGGNSYARAVLQEWRAAQWRGRALAAVRARLGSPRSPVKRKGVRGNPPA